MIIFQMTENTDFSVVSDKLKVDENKISRMILGVYSERML